MRTAIFMPINSPWSQEAALRIAEAGHETHVIDFSDSGNIDGYLCNRKDLTTSGIARLRTSVAGIHYIHSRFKSQWRYLTCARQLKRICRACGADVLLTLWGGGWATMAYLSGFRPYSIFVGGGDVIRVTGIQKSISRRALEAATVVFANGHHLGQRAREFAPAANVAPLYYGVDVVRFSPAPCADLPLNIICTRGFQAAYNNEYLIYGLAALPSSAPPCRVTFASTGNLLDATRALAAHLLSPSRCRDVVFLNGVTNDGMLDNLHRAHIYASFSRYDGTSISLLEALACGLFPVLSDIPANREWIDPALRNGILVPLDQPQALAEALNRALTDAPLRDRAAKINRQLVVDRADGRTNMAKLAAELESIATTWRSRRKPNAL